MIGVIADDLTGAAEIGAVGLRHGLRAEIVVAGVPSGKADLVCVDTESRSLPAEQAARRVAAAARMLLDSGATWIFKKTDSVLRGPVTEEIEAAMRVLGCTRALLLPANPSLGRTIRGGRYFIRGKPITRTDFAHDPEHPRTSSRVLKLIQRSENFPVRVVRRGERFSGAGIFIGEVGTRREVEQWMARRTPDMLLAGGAESFGAALRAKGFKRITVRRKSPSTPKRRELFVCGSASDACRRFVSRARRGGAAVFALPEELAWRSDFSPAASATIAARATEVLKGRRRAILHIGLPQVSDRRFARRLTEHLVQLAGRVLDAGVVDHVHAEGGETAGALLQRMGWKRLRVVRELAPGVATLATEGNGSMLFTIKPGSYLWPAEVLAFGRAA
jgi:uncharacterized protein YgbK (DUF1537 family)